jgi:hypothetical protein
MCGAIPPLLQYAFMAWCSVKAQGQLYLYITIGCGISDKMQNIQINAVTTKQRQQRNKTTKIQILLQKTVKITQNKSDIKYTHTVPVVFQR